MEKQGRIRGWEQCFISIQLVEDVSYGRTINSSERNATKALSEVLVVQEIDMKPADSTVEPTPLGKVGCASGFEGKGAMQKQSGQVNATSKVHCKHSDSVLNFDLLACQDRTKPRCENPGDSSENKSKLGQVKAETSCQRDVPTSATVQGKRRRSRGKSSEARDNPITRQVRKKPRQRESSKVNQVNVIQKSQRGRCENG
ncbi:hypothetical protein Gogos_022243 [Gossypium gossypioides]|uniref:Uncharacterized protein n=1 Tax=Gossypium gossypioides TaxID=34282 RepID=A0A7J9D2W5_GOSGO|nr:hypothetical protein [Gossypium gossypioides]